MQARHPRRIVRDSVVVKISPGPRRAFERFLETVVLTLMSSLAVVVLVGVIFRKAGASLVWYDEVASILLAWLTFYGSSLAALKRTHIGFPKLVEASPEKSRPALLMLRASIVIGFFLLTAWAGWRLLEVLEGTKLVSLPWVPAALAQSVIPIGAILFIAAEIVTTADLLKTSLAKREVAPR